MNESSRGWYLRGKRAILTRELDQLELEYIRKRESIQCDLDRIDELLNEWKEEEL